MEALDQQTKEKLQALQQRINDDPAFASQVEADPMAALIAEGISTDGFHVPEEVAGYMYETGVCICALYSMSTGKCWVKICGTEVPYD